MLIGSSLFINSLVQFREGGTNSRAPKHANRECGPKPQLPSVTCSDGTHEGVKECAKDVQVRSLAFECFLSQLWFGLVW